MDFRALHKLTYGIYIISTAYEGKKAGYIANTAFQVTSSPPQIAISCHRNNDSLIPILKSGIFTVSVLKRDVNPTLIGEFGFMSGSGTDKFAHVGYESKATGAPVVLDSCIAWLDCRVEMTMDLGSHMLIIGEVVDSGVITDDEPLTYAWYREKFKMVAPRNAPTYVEKERPQPSAETVAGDKQAAVAQQVAGTEKTSAPASASGSPSVPDFPAASVSDEAPVSLATSGSGTVSGTLLRSVSPEAGDDDREPWICAICGYVYRPEDGDQSVGIPPGTPFSDLPDDYRCPVCNADKDYFKPLM